MSKGIIAGAVAFMGFIVVGIVMLVVLFIGGIASVIVQQPTATAGSGCSPVGDFNQSQWDAAFAKAGVLHDKGPKFLEVAKKQGIDPVLFAAISFSETGWGKSKAVRVKHNPGGIMEIATGMATVKVFATLDEGIESMGVTLHNRIIKDGLNTIEKLGAIYAPIGASNDPTNLNANWVPTVHGITEKLGGAVGSCGGTTGSGKYIMPIDKPVISSGFVDRINPVTGVPEHHKGLDFAAPEGTLIKAADDGKVIFAGMGVSGSGYGGYGNVVAIEHAATKEWTLYGHQSKVMVKVGQQVKKGDIIGQVGSTGQSTGNHLHFEIRKSKTGNQIDPAPVLGVFPPK